MRKLANICIFVFITVLGYAYLTFQAPASHEPGGDQKQLPALSDKPETAGESDDEPAKIEANPVQMKPAMPNPGQQSFEEDSDRIIESKIASIEEFVPLSDDQKIRLRKVLEIQRKNNAESGNKQESNETVEDIIGEENLEFFIENRGQAFQSADEEDLEKEVLYISKKLGLDSWQEEFFRGICQETEAAIRNGRIIAEKKAQQGGPPAERSLKNIYEQAVKEEELKIQRILSEEQYEQYLEERAGMLREKRLNR